MDFFPIHGITDNIPYEDNGAKDPTWKAIHTGAPTLPTPATKRSRDQSYCLTAAPPSTQPPGKGRMVDVGFLWSASV